MNIRENNTEYYDRFSKLRWDSKTLPGLPETLSVSRGFGQSLMSVPSTSAFLWEGYAYARGADEAHEEYGPSFSPDLWEEIKGSQYLSAKEDYLSAAKESSQA